MNFNVFENFLFFNFSKVFFIFNWNYYFFNTTSNCCKSFSLRPPIGRTLPLKVISPVIAILFFTGTPVKAETIDVNMAIPAEGPSLGVAPSGT